MAKQVSLEDDLEAFAQTVDDVYHAIRTTNATYHSQLEPISSEVSSFSFGTWDDDVKKKLEESFETSFKTNGVYAIEDDFSSGGLKSLLDNMDQLYIDSDSAKRLKETYTRLQNKRDSEPETVDGKPNPNRPSFDSVKNAKNNVQAVIDSMNSTLKILAGIVFGGAASTQSSSAPETPGFTYNVTESPYKNSTLDREDYSYEYGKKKITISMSDDDSPTGNMYWTQYGTPVNKTKNIQVLMGDDGKYYEYVTYTETQSYDGKQVFTQTTRRELSGEPSTITITTTENGRTTEKSVTLFLDSELGILAYRQLCIDAGLANDSLPINYTLGEAGYTINFDSSGNPTRSPDSGGKVVVIKTEGGNGEYAQLRTSQTIDANDQRLKIVTPNADGTFH